MADVSPAFSNVRSQPRKLSGLPLHYACIRRLSFAADTAASTERSKRTVVAGFATGRVHLIGGRVACENFQGCSGGRVACIQQRSFAADTAASTESTGVSPARISRAVAAGVSPAFSNVRLQPARLPLQKAADVTHAAAPNEQPLSVGAMHFPDSIFL
jgi:hypothetical protein